MRPILDALAKPSAHHTRSAVLVGLHVLAMLAVIATTPYVGPERAWAMALFCPIPTVLAAFVLVRPYRSPPTRMPTDWDLRGLHPWVVVDDDPYWLERAEAEVLVAKSLERPPIYTTFTHDGVKLVVPPHDAPAPPLDGVLGASWRAMMVAGLVVSVPPILRDVALGRVSSTSLLCMVLAVPLAMAVTNGIVLLPWWVVLGLWTSYPGLGRAYEVTLTGRMLKFGTETFPLGHPEQRVELDGGTLTVSRPGQTLVLRGAAAHLAFLASAIAALPAHDDSEADVPAALRALVPQ
ncbi:MAG: hypothetical protein R3F61_02635 [Myxococcota bacterium]